MLTAIYIHYTQKWLCLQWYIFTEVIIYTLARAPRWPQQASNAHLGKDAQPIQKSHHFPKTWQENRLSKWKPSFINYFLYATSSYLWALLNLHLFDQIAANTEVLVQPAYRSFFSSSASVDLTLILETHRTNKRPLSKLISRANQPNRGSLAYLCNLVCQ